MASSTISSDHSHCIERIKELQSSKDQCVQRSLKSYVASRTDATRLSLTSQLATNELQLSNLSARVHSKLLEQKNKLQSARSKITSLQDDLLHEQGRRRVLQGLLDREEGAGRGDGRAEDHNQVSGDKLRRGGLTKEEGNDMDRRMERPRSASLLDAFS